MNFIEISENSSDRIYQILDEHGYKLLGSGADASVWTKSEAEVIKIIIPEDPDTLGQAMHTFYLFYEFCQAHPEYENLPRFVDIGGAHHKIFTLDGQDYVMIGQERLEPIPRGSFAEAMVWIMSAMVPTGQRWEQVRPKLRHPEFWSHFTDGMDVNEIVGYVDNWTRKDAAKWGLLYTLMALLYHTGRINQLAWDLHTENAMMRDGHMIVITDPWFNTQNL